LKKKNQYLPKFSKIFIILWLGTSFCIFLQKLVKKYYSGHWKSKIINKDKKERRSYQNCWLLFLLHHLQCIDCFLCNHLQNINTCKIIWESTQLDFKNVVVARKYSCIKKNMRITMTFFYLCVIYCLCSHTRLGLNPQIGRPLSKIVVFFCYQKSNKVLFCDI
jgi:uncharacterized membrane protein